MLKLFFVFLLQTFSVLAVEYSTHSAKTSKYSIRFQKQMNATVAIINEDRFNQNPFPFDYSYKTCSPTVFSKDVLWSNCSGVLVGSDLVLTAAHCANKINCANLTFAFDYFDNQSIEMIQFNYQKQYKCKEIVYSQYSRDEKNPIDIALVKLDRKVLDRKPIRLEGSKKSTSKKVFAIGHPLGTSLKIQEGFMPMELAPNKSIQKISMAAHAGLSGGGVYNIRGDLLGILVRGGPTFEHDIGCQRELKCKQEDCSWAEIQKIP